MQMTVDFACKIQSGLEVLWYGRYFRSGRGRPVRVLWHDRKGMKTRPLRLAIYNSPRRCGSDDDDLAGAARLFA